LERGGWVEPRREVKEKPRREWWGVEEWVDVEGAVVPLEERLEERIERARFLGVRGKGVVSCGGVRKGGGGEGAWWYHWDEMEKREASALLRDMVPGRWYVGTWLGCGGGRTDLHGVCVSDKLLPRSQSSKSVGASARNVLLLLPSFKTKILVRQLLGMVSFAKIKRICQMVMLLFHVGIVAGS
jgi:hypothetical protein